MLSNDPFPGFEIPARQDPRVGAGLPHRAGPGAGESPTARQRGRDHGELLPSSVMKVILAQPRGVCAGVERAVTIVERALERYGRPLYVRKEIVHNRYTIERLRAEGVTFVDELDAVPNGARVIFAAHGVAPTVPAEAERRGLQSIDATCPLVSKVHHEVLRYARRGYHLFLIGHEGHDEVVGTLGHAPDSITLITDVEQASTVTLPDRSEADGADAETPLLAVTQTTLSVDDTRAILDVLQRRFPQLETPKADDICYATQNRQYAIKALCEQAQVDGLLVVGSPTSSNSQRLVELAQRCGVDALLIDDPASLDARWLAGRARVGVSAGASSPEVLVEALLEKLQPLGAVSVETLEAISENVVFSLPKELR